MRRISISTPKSLDALGRVIAITRRAKVQLVDMVVASEDSMYRVHMKVEGPHDEEYGRLTGRRYGGLVEWYRTGDAKHIVVCAGAWCSDAKHAVDSLRARGVPVGLMRIRFVRPFPREEVAKLDQYETAVVYDRDITPVGGILSLEVKAALSRARVVNIVAGIAGVDFDSRHFYETIQNAIDGELEIWCLWYELP